MKKQHVIGVTAMTKIPERLPDSRALEREREREGVEDGGGRGMGGWGDKDGENPKWVVRRTVDRGAGVANGGEWATDKTETKVWSVEGGEWDGGRCLVLEKERRRR